jgi:hypothetical protein
MADVNIFTSSTSYDLSQVRQDLCKFKNYAKPMISSL